MNTAEFCCKEAKQLLGGTIESVVYDPPTRDNLQKPSFGITVKKPDGKTVVVWIDSDAEGNDCGFIKIEHNFNPFKLRK